MNEIHLPRTIINRLLSHAQSSGDAEVCGLIGALNGQATTLYPIPNVSTDQRHRFAMDPHAHIAAMRQMREAGEELFAIYHSHPDSPAAPSATDITEAAYPGALYLVISLDTQGVLELQGFYIRNAEVMPVPLKVV